MYLVGYSSILKYMEIHTMKKFFKNNKLTIIKLSIALLILVGVSVGVYFLFKKLGITDIDNLHSLIDSAGTWGIVLFIVLQVITTILLCFVPGTSMTFITLGVILYGANYKTFLICFSGVVISSVLMDIIGRYGGVKAIKWLVGEKTYDEAKDLVREKGMVYVPFMYLLPLFPDDAICMVCGATRIKFWLHFLYIFLCRGIGCATIVFGISFLPKELMENLEHFNWDFISTHLWDYFTMITVIVVWIIILFFIARKIDKWLTKKLIEKKKQEQ